MDDQQSNFKVVDRRPFNPDGTPRELSPEEKEETERVAESLKVPPAESAPRQEPTQSAPTPETTTRRETTTPPPRAETRPRAGGDPLDDPASFLSLIMSLVSI